MNELKLSDNLNQIEMEINYHRRKADESIWEMGRRLKHVKEKDLTHGQFGNWLKHMSIERRMANKLITISESIPQMSAGAHLKIDPLYEIATLPEPQKQEQLERIEHGDNPTRKELRELKRKNREQEQRIKELENREPQKEVVEKPVEVEVVPEDYEQLKRENERLSDARDQANKRAHEANQQLEQLLKEREEVDRNAARYESLKRDIQDVEKRKELSLKKVKAIDKYKNFSLEIDNMLATLGSMLYQADFELLDDEGIDYSTYHHLVDKVRRWCDDADKKISEHEVIEGEIIG